MKASPKQGATHKRSVSDPLEGCPKQLDTPEETKMNTTTTTTDSQVDTMTRDSDATEVASPSTKPRRPALWRRIVVALVSTAGVATAATVLTPAPANAAAASTVRVCFDDQTGGWRTAGMPWQRKVSYMLYNPSTGRWQVQGTFASATGCMYFSVYPGYKTFFEVYENWGSYYYSAQTYVYVFGSGLYYNLGNYNVVKTLTF
jgi:hypothetical protein